MLASASHQAKEFHIFQRPVEQRCQAPRAAPVGKRAMDYGGKAVRQISEGFPSLNRSQTSAGNLSWRLSGQRFPGPSYFNPFNCKALTLTCAVAAHPSQYLLVVSLSYFFSLTGLSKEGAFSQSTEPSRADAKMGWVGRFVKSCKRCNLKTKMSNPSSTV